MVTAKTELSNIFLHTGQDIEKTGESSIQAGAGLGKSLEESTDWHFNFDAQVKRLSVRGFMAGGGKVGRRF